MSAYSLKLGFYSKMVFFFPIKTVKENHPNDVLVWVSGSGYPHKDKHGKYRCLLEYKNKTKYLEKETPCNSTANQSMILGTIEAVAQIKKPCNVCIISASPLGFKEAFRNKGPNAELIVKLCDLLIEKECQLTEILCPSYSEDIKTHILSAI